MKKIYPFICFLFLLATISLQFGFIHKRYGQRKINPACPWCEEQIGEDVLYIPISAPLMRIFAPADPHFLADLLWMRTSYYFGQHFLSDKSYPHLFHLLDLITDLSPGWENPYLYGAVILASEAEAAEDGFYFIEKGLLFHPEEWQLWFFKGYYLWKYRENKLDAAQAFHKASALPGAPVYLANLSATFATEVGERELALRFLQESLRNVQDPALRKEVLKKIEKVMKNE